MCRDTGWEGGACCGAAWRSDSQQHIIDVPAGRGDAAVAAEEIAEEDAVAGIGEKVNGYLGIGRAVGADPG